MISLRERNEHLKVREFITVTPKYLNLLTQGSNHTPPNLLNLCARRIILYCIVYV